MEDFLTSFFITPFTGLAEGIATATSPLDVIDAVDGFVWGPIMILLLLGTHIFMTIRTGFIQRKIGTGIKLSVTKDDPSNADGDITQFGALTTALAATIGTGNIVGVGTGLLFGGPGAIFWMWITGILGIATKYSEVFIGVKYRVKDHSGKMLGGAMYALERGFKNKKAGRILAILFALFASLAAFGIGASTQSNSLADALYNTSLIDGKAIPQWLVGAVVVALVAIVILGGIKSISKVCEKLVPVMAVFYVVCCLIIIGMNGQFLGEAIRQIIVGAFTPAGAAGGAVGSTITLALQFGFKRGIFSNESGLGSAPLVASSATTKNPARQALVSMTGTFWDTVVVCAITGLMLMTTLLANPELSTAIANGTISSGAGLATAAFEKIRVWPPGAADWPGHLRIFHHPGLEPVRQPRHQLPAGQEGRPPLLHRVPAVRILGLHNGRRCCRQRHGLQPQLRGMECGRRDERAHGHPELHRGPGPVRHHRPRNETLRVRPQPGGSRQDRDSAIPREVERFRISAHVEGARIRAPSLFCPKPP